MKQLTFLKNKESNLVTLKEASEWASNFLERAVSVSNISYLIQYGRIKKYKQNDTLLVANDKYNLYPAIAELAGMKIVNRPVLHRVEKIEIIYFLKQYFN
ncbi:MAG: hypothetical protein ACP5T0_08340 [Verrucomicrobiia bacterium]